MAHRPQLPERRNDELHDSGYGQCHIGPQAALVATIHKQVPASHPVVVTMPSDWVTAPADPVHPSGSAQVGLAVGIGSSAIRVVHPWHGFMQDASDAW